MLATNNRKDSAYGLTSHTTPQPPLISQVLELPPAAAVP